MREPISLDQAEYKSELVASLWEVILEKAHKEKCSPVLYDLLSVACDFNQEIRQALITELDMGDTE